MRPQRILVLYWHHGPGELRLAIKRHLHVLDHSRLSHDVVYFNALNGVPSWLRCLQFDVVVLHTTFLCLRWSHVFHTWKWEMRWLNDFKGLKVAIPQDEYDHSEMLDEWLYEIGVDLIITNFDEQHRSCLYPLMCKRALFRKCLTGYLDDEDVHAMQRRLLPPVLRSRDIVYRASHLPYWFGSHGQLKHRIADPVAVQAVKHGLTIDISTDPKDTILGVSWLDFLASGRTVIGTESGSSVLDKRGAVKAKIQSLCAECSDLTFEEVDRRMPKGWDDHRFLAISPRHLEAVMTGTCQILLEGVYDGVLVPHVHYLPLKRDFSNLDELLDAVKDAELLGKISSQAYKDVCESDRYSYRQFAHVLDEAIEELSQHRSEQSVPLARRNARPPFAVAKSAARIAEVQRVARYRTIQAILSSPLYWCVFRHPLVSAAKLQLAARLFVGSRAMLSLLTVSLPAAKRAGLRVRDILMDCFMFRIMEQIQHGHVWGLKDVEIPCVVDAKSDALIFRSVYRDNSSSDEPSRNLRPLCEGPEQQRYSSLRWDHSLVGSRVAYPIVGSRRLNLSVGQSGSYIFRTFPVLMKVFPKQMRLLLDGSIRGALRVR